MPTIKLFILCASSSEPLGGMEKHILSLCEELCCDTRLHIVLAAAPPLIKACQNTFPPNISANLRLLKLPSQLSRRSPKLNYTLYKYLRNEAPDIVHCHGYKALQLAKNSRSLDKALGMIRARKKVRLPKLITTIHGTKSNAEILRTTEQVLCVSRDLQENLAQQGIKSLLIENGVPPFQGPALSKQSICSRYDFDPSLPLALSVGRLAKVKNFAALMRAFKGLKANLLVLGDGPEQQKLAALQGKNCVLGGHQPEARAYLEAADCLIISSLREGFSLSMVEALQAHTPVLSSPVSGTKTLLPSACLLDISDDAALHQSLKICLNQLDDLTRQSLPAFAYAAENLTQSAMAQKLMHVYTELSREQA